MGKIEVREKRLPHTMLSNRLQSSIRPVRTHREATEKGT